MTLTHLQRLEAESIHILREVVAEADNPVMLYSIGKDSAVMLHLAVKAFYPAVPSSRYMTSKSMSLLPSHASSARWAGSAPSIRSPR